MKGDRGKPGKAGEDWGNPGKAGEDWRRLLSYALPFFRGLAHHVRTSDAFGA